MLLDGERVSGQDVRTQNVTAAMAVANIVKTSLGPGTYCTSILHTSLSLRLMLS
jgi:chaperonin GroEL (HSP60 family)